MINLDIVLGCIDDILSWVNSLNSHFRFLPLLFSLFILALIYRFLLYPLLGGGAGSDSAKRRKK